MRFDWFIPSISVIEEILKEIPVLIFDAMFDIQDGPVGTEEWIYNYLFFDQKEQFVNTPRNIYYYKSDD